MAWNENRDRCQKIYFGEPQDYKPTKKEVGDFIMNKMGAIYDGGPAWSEGVPQLVEMGMRNWDKQLGVASLETFDELREERDRVKRKNRELREQLRNQRKQVQPERAVDQVERTEARILEVLCREYDSKTERPAFVSLPAIVQQTGFKYSTVVYYLNNLAREEFGGTLSTVVERKHEQLGNRDLTNIVSGLD